MSTPIDTAKELFSERLNPALESVEQNVRDARRAIGRGRRAAEDFAADAALRVRRHPLRSVTVAMTTGAAAGCLIGFGLGWVAGRRTSQAQ
jgi:hypothetical protein